MSMKTNVVRVVSLTLVTAMLVCVLAACATTLSGTYSNDEGLIKQSFTFKEDNKVEVSAFGIDVEGEYHIEDIKSETESHNLSSFKIYWVHFTISAAKNQLSIYTKHLSLAGKYLALYPLLSSTHRGIMCAATVHGGCYDSL